MARKAIKARATSRKAVKAQSDYSLFKALAPRMMRDLMRDFSPLADFQAAGVVGNGVFTQIQEKTQPYQDRRAALDGNGLCRKAQPASCFRKSPERDGARTRQL
jgi:hypothetical protein